VVIYLELFNLPHRDNQKEKKINLYKEILVLYVMRYVPLKPEVPI
jgi:hypothetical protein